MSVPGARTEMGVRGLAWGQVDDPTVTRLLQWLVEPPAWVRQDLTTAQRFAAALESDLDLLDAVRECLAAVKMTVGTGLVLPGTTRGKGDLLYAVRREEEARKKGELSGGDVYRFATPVVAYEVPDLSTLAVLEAVIAARENLPVKKCGGCGVVFVPVPAKAKYCQACRKDSTAQQLYYHRKKAAMTAEEKEALKKKWKEAQRKSRARRKAGGNAGDAVE